MAGGLIDELFVAIGFKVDDKTLKEADNNLKSFIGSAVRVVGAVAAAAYAFDRMANSLMKTNQAFINFNRQTGLSIGNVQRIATAGMMADYNMTPETVMQSMQAMQSNLAQIRLGQGNIEPFQLLGISPVGKDADQVFEDLRQAIKGLDDMTATNIIQQMGFSPEMITVLRMTNSELQEMNSLMLSPEQRQALQQYSMEMRKVQMEFGLLRDKALIAILPSFIKFLKGLEAMAGVIERLVEWTVKFTDSLGKFKIVAIGVFTGILAAINPVYAAVYALYLILEDLAVWAMGGKSFFGTTFDIIGDKINQIGKAFSNMFMNTKGVKDLTNLFNSMQNKNNNNNNNDNNNIPGQNNDTMSYNPTNSENILGNNIQLPTPQAAMDNATAMATPSGTMANIAHSQNMTQNVYNNFPNVDAAPIAQKTNDLLFAYMQVDRAV